MSDAMIAMFIVVVAAVVLALPRGLGDVPAAQLGRVRRRQVLRAVAGAIAVSLWPALTWHGQWWFGPSAGLAILSGYVFAMRPRARRPATRPVQASLRRQVPRARTGEDGVSFRASSPPAP
jgi:hypothetical protein